jgi:branched-chain amino acid transport system substrate-binding protein
MKRIFKYWVVVHLAGAVFAGQFAFAQPNLSSPSQDLVIGQVASLSGSNGADLGQGLQLGLQLAVEKTNAAGGIYGRKLRLVTKDDKYIPEETVKLTQELIEQDKPIALAGYRGTANTLAVMKANVLTDAGIALVGTLTGAKEVQGVPNIYHVRTSYQQEIGQIVEQLGRIGLTRIALFYVDDAFGNSGREAVEQVLAKQNRKPAAIAAYDKAADKVIPSIELAVQTLIAAQPQAVVMVAVGDPVYEFIKQFRALAPSPQLVSISVVNPDAVVQKVGLKIAHGIGFSQVFPYPYNDTIKVVREYRALLSKHAPDQKPSYFSLEGYISGLVLAQAIRNAGGNPTRAKVIDALNKIPPLDLGGFFVRFDPVSRNGSRYAELTVIGSDGKLRR